MIETEKNIVNEFRDRHPFRVPEGYFEGFTADMMHRLPPRKISDAKVIPFHKRMMPWLYVAAVFAGMIILFNVYNKDAGVSKNGNPVLLTSVNTFSDDMDDADFFEYLEELYVDKYAVSYIYDNLID